MIRESGRREGLRLGVVDFLLNVRSSFQNLIGEMNSQEGQIIVTGDLQEFSRMDQLLQADSLQRKQRFLL
jgi:hypothetical protein